MRKNTLLASVAALSLFGATTIASAQSMNQSSPKGAEPPAAAAQDQKAAPQQAQDKPAATTQQKSATTPASDGRPSATTGAAASGGTAAASAPPAEKRGQIATAIKQEKIPATTNVNFNISVGARVPSTVTFYPVPSRIIEIYPEWRGYQVILVNGRYIVVRPQTYEIVYIIEG